MMINKINPEDQPRRSERLVAKQQRCMLMNVNSDPLSYEEALTSPESDLWKEAIQKEYDSMLKIGTWEQSELPSGRKALNLKWMFKKKYLPSGELERFKARLVAKGYNQKKGIDYFETSAPVVRYVTIRFLLAMAAKFDLDIFQMDAVTAFLQGKLSEEIFVNQPQ